jgi:hypothetical protein
LALCATDTAHAAVPASARQAAAVALAVPSPGDVSYAMVRVRLAHGQSLAMPTGLTGTTTIFSDHVGGLAIRARAANWKALKATTRVYVVVSRAAGAPADERDVALFVVRRTGGHAASTNPVRFTVGNAGPVVGSFWVRSVTRSGYADVFHARNIFTTALANWSRYTLALRLAHAVHAALHPDVRPAAPAAASADAMTAAATASTHTTRLPGPWTGGQHADARVKAMYRLLLGALHRSGSWGAFKGSAAVPSFIQDELDDTSLANRWRTEVQHVPAIVPDTYAALAQEEKRFTHVAAPHLSHRTVVIADSTNSADAEQEDDASLSLQWIYVNDPDATQQYGGSVTVVDPTGASPTYTCDVPHCSFAYGPVSSVTLDISPQPDPGAAVLYTGGGSGCTALPTQGYGACTITFAGTDPVFSADFTQGARLIIATAPAGTVSDASRDFTCSTTMMVCAEELPIDSTTTVTEPILSPPPAQLLWSGCDESIGNSCTVTMTGPRTVVGSQSDTLMTAVQGAPGSGDTITGSGINCGEDAGGDATGSCSTDVVVGDMEFLTANAVAPSTFSSWTGCGYATGSVCSVEVDRAQNVTANFVAPTPAPAPTPTPPTYPLSVSATTRTGSTNTGYVTSSPSGIDCGTTAGATACNADFGAGATVTLTATLTGNMGSLDWTGACAGQGGYTCTISMAAAENAGVQFN